MSYLNINYSTLEDAWGSNFERNHKRQNNNNVCNLYKNRNAKIEKPYKTVRDSTHIRPIYDETNYVKYHGYKDGKPYARKHNKLSKYKLQFPYKRKPKVTSNMYISDEEEEYVNEEIDEEYIYEESFEPIKPKIKKQQFKQQPPLIRSNFSYIDDEDAFDPKPKHKKPIIIEEEDEETDHILKKQVNSSFKNKPKRNTVKHFVQPEDNVYEDISAPSAKHFSDDDDDDTDDDDDVNNNYGSDSEFESYLKDPIYEEEDTDDGQDDETVYNNVIKAIYEESINDNKKQHKSNKNIKKVIEEEDFIIPFKKKQQERVFLDLVLYTLSGIILIFILEQFIQIGMKIKTPI
jgi:hypothetical protein